jgi:hypothetical protein
VALTTGGCIPFSWAILRLVWKKKIQNSILGEVPEVSVECLFVRHGVKPRDLL